MSKPEMITVAGRERMEKMISFLRELDPKKFYFGDVWMESEECGTIACAMGWAPAIFPEIVQRVPTSGDDVFQIEGRKLKEWRFDEVAEILFGISNKTACALFIPEDQRTLEEVSLQECQVDATPSQVADMLESFLSQVADI